MTERQKIEATAITIALIFLVFGGPVWVWGAMGPLISLCTIMVVGLLVVTVISIYSIFDDIGGDDD